MTPARIVLSLSGMVALLFVLASIEIPPSPEQQAVALPFAIPDWVPDEATKRRALRRAYELVRGITDAWGAVDVSKEGSVIRLQQPE